MKSRSTPLVACVFALALLACGGSSVVQADAGPEPPSLPFVCPGDCDAFAFTRFYEGDTSRALVASPTAWKQFGHDIDGKVTLSTSTDVCRPAAGAVPSIQEDGDRGIDNSFGANFFRVLDPTGNTPVSTPWNEALVRAGAGELLLLAGLGTGATQTKLRGATFAGMGLDAPPKLDGSDVWPISSTSVENGDLTLPTAPLPAGGLSANVYDSGRGGDGMVFVVIPIQGMAFRIPVRRVRITGTLSADHARITEGQLSGVIKTDELIAQLWLVRGRLGSLLCSAGSTVWGRLVTQIRQLQDILTDGTQDPARDCDAISIGLGFEGVRVLPGAIVDDPPWPDVCP